MTRALKEAEIWSQNLMIQKKLEKKNYGFRKRKSRAERKIKN